LAFIYEVGTLRTIVSIKHFGIERADLNLSNS
jgi:hypothetical protein